jgi:hypothetical protein
VPAWRFADRDPDRPPGLGHPAEFSLTPNPSPTFSHVGRGEPNIHVVSIFHNPRVRGFDERPHFSRGSMRSLATSWRRLSSPATSEGE